MEKKKRTFWRRGLALVLAVSLIAGTFLMLPTKAADTSSLGKLGDTFTENNHTFRLDPEVNRFFLTLDPKAAGNEALLQTVQLAQRQFAADGIDLPIVWHTSEDRILEGDIVVRLTSSSGAPSGITTDEGYQLKLDKQRNSDVYAVAEVTATGVDGLLYGLNMLQKHLRYAKQSTGYNDGIYTIDGFTMVDQPDTKQRAVSLDCGRKYLSKDYICNYIKEMSWMGYNTIELHFSDDSGFRIDIWGDEAYHKDANGDGVAYNPANDFSWLPGSQVTSWTHDGSSGLTGINFRKDPDRGKYLTTAELVEIIECAKEYHIDVIPAFDCPAHLDYTTWKYEQNYLNNKNYFFTSTYFTDANGNGKTYKAADVAGCINYTGYKTGTKYTDTTGVTQTMKWPYYTCVDITDEHAKAFLFELYIDIADFFKEYAGSSDLSIGADEVNLNTDNLASGYSFAWGFNEFVPFINELNALLNNKQYTMRMYNDFMGTTKYTTSSGKSFDDGIFDKNIEILYWDSPYDPSATTTASTWDGHTATVQTYVDDDRILYNCIQTNTYYVLRINETQGDARSKTCYQWTFFNSDEEAIYADWYPADISEHGRKYSEDVADVTENQLGGGYFLVWHDYAALNTETEVWNGVKDFARKTNEFYSLRDRMWSNIIKQWNWDINTTGNSQGQITYSAFADVRNKIGDFPGLDTDPNTGTYSGDSYAKAAPLPAAVDPIQLGDHANLTAKLNEGKIEQGNYTNATYAIYSAAYNHAVEVNNNISASQEALTEALNRLVRAEEGLKELVYLLNVYYKANINGNVISIDYKTYELTPPQAEAFNLYIDPVAGYSYLRTEGAATFTLSDAGDGSGYLTGSITKDTSITLWYESSVDTSRLDALLFNSYTSKEIGSTQFTDASWAVYDAALTKAKGFSANISTKQDDVDELANALADASNALITPGDGGLIEIEFMNKKFYHELQVGLYIKTSSNVESITIKNVSQNNRIETPTYYSGEVQVLNDGSVVKNWVVFFVLPNSGDYEVIATYTNTDGSTGTVSQII